MFLKKNIKRIYAVLLCAVMLLSAMPFSAFAFSIDPPFRVDGKSASTLADAFDKAADTGSVISQDGNTSDLQTIKAGVEVTKNVTLSLGKGDFNTNVNRISYTGTGEPLFTVKNGGVLTIKYSAIYGNSNAVNTRGGLIRVEKGGTLILDGTADKPVVISGCKLTSKDSRGGAIYAEKGGKVIVKGVAFADNSAAKGDDIYAEQRSDVTVADGVSVNAAYGEGVDINALNLVLTGEIGLVFHTTVPEEYRDGSFVLTSRTGDTVTYKIGECGKDAEGRYLAKYNVSAIELSEPVTLTVCGKSGDALASKSRSVEEYGKVLLSESGVTEKEKEVVKTLLNYGHFAQTACAEYNGWKIGESYAETAKYADVETAVSVFDQYTYTQTGDDPDILKIVYQLELDYKTDLLIHFRTDEKPTVFVGETAAEVEESKIGGYDYFVRIKGISALDLEKQYTVKVNDRITLTLSAMSYCKMAIGQGGENCRNAVKALYEFYLATVQYNED